MCIFSKNHLASERAIKVIVCYVHIFDVECAYTSILHHQEDYIYRPLQKNGVDLKIRRFYTNIHNKVEKHYAMAFIMVTWVHYDLVVLHTVTFFYLNTITEL